VRAARADHAELFLGDRDRLLHLLLGVKEYVVDHCGLLWRCLGQSSRYPGRR